MEPAGPIVKRRPKDRKQQILEQAVRLFIDRGFHSVKLEDIAGMHGLATRVLGEVLYFNASAVKLRTLINPAQKRDLERVLLVTNR